MAHPLYTLKHEHRVIERVLRALDGICLKLDAGAEVPPEALAEVVDFISSFADHFHHRKEEDILFPALKRLGISSEGGPLSVMEREHETERKLMVELRQAIEAFKNGSEVASRLFVEDARRFIEMLTSHIEVEDRVLYRLADEVLADEDKKAIGKAFSEAEAELEPGAIEMYERKATRLEKTWAL